MSCADDMGVTENAVLLLGYIAGAVIFNEDPTYRVVDVDAATGSQVLEHTGKKNTYRMTVVQLTGSV